MDRRAATVTSSPLARRTLPSGTTLESGANHSTSRADAARAMTPSASQIWRNAAAARPQARPAAGKINKCDPSRAKSPKPGAWAQQHEPASCRPPVVLLATVAFVALARPVQGGADHCYSDIGCFPLGDEFYHPRHRPFNVRPWHRRHIGIQFELFNAHHPAGHPIRPWNRASLAAARFDPRLETKVVVPGWLDNVERAVWVRQLRDALLWLWAPSNILVVRWRNFTPYTLATANTRVVGAELANLVRFIELELAYDRAYYHMIGHSLGAHISAYCGQRLAGLGRITALDPARPFFQGMPKSVRLDRGDAEFVDAIHSDFTPENAVLLLMSFGMTTPVGHVDFYPNGPPLLQPGCLRDTLGAARRGILNGLRYGSLSVAFVDALRYLTACDHQRSHEWFIESLLNRHCLFVGLRCDTFEGLINGRCSCDDSPGACAIMGIHADQMYLQGAHHQRWPYGRARRARGGSAGREWRAALALPGPGPAEQLVGATPLEDAALADYLRAALLGAASRRDLAPESERSEENWYEHSGRWHLKTNGRPNYCANQYQVLVFLGPLGTRAGPDGQLRANLVVSIIGSRGQLLNQRFVPRSARLDSFTMQPFFILLEGSYSLGQIKSVAIAWEARRDPDLVQATVSFQSNRLAAAQTQLAAVKAKHPWLSKTLQYDRSRAFQWRAPPTGPEPHQLVASRRAASEPGAPGAARELAKSLGAARQSPREPTQGRISRRQDAGEHTVGLVGELPGLAHLKQLQQAVEVLHEEQPEGWPPELALPQVADVGEREQSFIEPLVEPSGPSQWVSDQLAWQDDGKLEVELHNVELAEATSGDEFIVVKRVVVSPLQADYGRAGRKARPFCSPRAGFRLRQDQTVRLEPSIVGHCH